MLLETKKNNFCLPSSAKITFSWKIDIKESAGQFINGLPVLHGQLFPIYSQSIIVIVHVSYTNWIYTKISDNINDWILVIWVIITEFYARARLIKLNYPKNGIKLHHIVVWITSHNSCVEYSTTILPTLILPTSIATFCLISSFPSSAAVFIAYRI